MAERLILIRHGQSTANLASCFLGRLDAPLSEKGRQQILALGAHFSARKTQPWVVHCSPLLRARQSAELLFPMAPRLDDRLVEQSFGAWERLGREEARAAFPADFQAWSSGDPACPPTGGESLQQVAVRLRSFLDEVLLSPLPACPEVPKDCAAFPDPAMPQSSIGRAQVVVAHGSLLQTLLCLLLGTSLNNHWPFRFHQAGWAELEHGQQGFSLLSFQAPPVEDP